MRVAVLVEEKYQVLEVWYPYYRLREEGVETVMLGTGRFSSYPSKEGYPAPEELSIKKADANYFDGVVIPGGWAPDFLRRHRQINEFVKKMHKQEKLVASICHGGWVLVSANILNGKKATCFSAIKDDVINAGAEYLDDEVIVDGNIITSRRPDDLPAFCREMIKFLKRSG